LLYSTVGSAVFGDKQGELLTMAVAATRSPCVQNAVDEKLGDALQRMGKSLTAGSTVVWTVAGGEEYAKVVVSEFGRMIHNAYEASEFPAPTFFIVSLDETVAQVACEQICQTMIWKEPKKAYSRVADAKFGISAALCDMGSDFLFVEMDVWLKGIPPSSGADITVATHQEVPEQANIGYFEV
jgi:hypothetical protein